MPRCPLWIYRRWWRRALPPLGETMLKVGFRPRSTHLPLLPPGRASSLAIASTGDRQPPPSRSASPSSWRLLEPVLGPLPQEMTGRAGRALEIIWCGDHLTDGELGGGGDGTCLRGQAHAQLGSPGTAPPHPRIWPAAFTFILNLGDYRVQRLVALSLSTLALHMLAACP